AGDRRVVEGLQEPHGLLAGHAGDLAVNELIGDDVADDEHPTTGEAVDEPEKTLFSFGVAGWRVERSANQHSALDVQLSVPARPGATRRRIQPTASIRLSATASATNPSGDRA